MTMTKMVLPKKKRHFRHKKSQITCSKSENITISPFLINYFNNGYACSFFFDDLFKRLVNIADSTFVIASMYIFCIL